VSEWLQCALALHKHGLIKGSIFWMQIGPDNGGTGMPAVDFTRLMQAYLLARSLADDPQMPDADRACCSSSPH
jgi:hypothetical protein